MIEYVKQDVTSPTSGIIMHGCNAQGVMGSGVAKIIKAKFPIAFERYKVRCDSVANDRQRLMGSVQIVHVNADRPELDALYVCNAITQLNYGRDGKAYACLDAISAALNATAVFAKCRGDLPIYIPRIGCGLGGLDWADVGAIVASVAEEHGVTIVVCDYE